MFHSKIKALVRLAYKRRYGVRGALRPPRLHGNKDSMLNRWRRYFHLIEDSIYSWTGLPEEWADWISRQ